MNETAARLPTFGAGHPLAEEGFKDDGSPPVGAILKDFSHVRISIHRM